MSPIERILVGAFGAFLLGLGIFVLRHGDISLIWRCLAGALLAALGGNAVYSAIASKRPWISKIGPLP